MPPRFAGHIVDEDNAEIEVWVTEDNTRVLLQLNDTKVGDFLLGQPTADNPVELAADRVAKGEAKRLAVFENGTTSKLMKKPDYHRRLRRWPGDGRMH